MTDFDFVFNRHQTSKIPREKILDELERIANVYQYTEFRRIDFNKISHFHSATVERDFGNWTNAIEALRKRLKGKGIELQPRYVGKYSEKELFAEMERIWRMLGHRPSRGEWNSSSPRISYDTYTRHFDGWQNACLKFIEYKMGKYILGDYNLEGLQDENKQKDISSNITRGRNIPLRIRLKVLNRDNFRCILCGRSPATDIGVELHIDHIIPVSMGGENTLKNLRTLCKECNLGKGDEQNI